MSPALAAPAIHLTEPRALWGLLLLLPVLAAHLWRRRRRRLIVPFAPLLLEARGRARGGGLGPNLKDRAALAARLAAVAALTLALAGPSPRPPPPPVPLAIVIDGDVTTAAREDDGRARLAHALDLAAALARAHDEGPVHAVLAAEAPRRLAREAADRHALAERLAGWADGPAAGSDGEAPAPARARGDLDAAARLARSLAGEGGRVVVLTARDPAPTGVAPEALLGAGSSDDDQGLVDLALRADAGRVRVATRLKNFARAPRERVLHLELDGRERERRTVALAGAAESAEEFALDAPPEGGVLTLRLEGQDRFAANDRVEAVLAPERRIAVLVVHGGAGVRPYTAALLAAMPEVDRVRTRAVAASELAAAPARDVTLVDGAALPEGALGPGAWLFLAPLGGALPFQVAAPVERPLVWRARAGHPLVRDLDLADAWVSRAWPLVPGEGLTGLAFAAGDEPVLAEGEREGLAWVALGLDPEASDLPVRAAFPLLLRNALLRLARAPRDPLPPFVRSGELLLPRAPLPHGPSATLAWGAGERATAALTPEQGWRTPPGAAGLLTVATGEGAAGWRGRTALVTLDAGISIAPARPATAAPAPRADPADLAALFTRLLAGLAALLLVLDLGLSRSRAAGEAPLAPPVAMSALHGSIAPWSTGSSAKR